MAAAPLAPPGAEAASASGSLWQWQNPRPQGNDVSAAACPSATVCLANGSRAVMRTTDSGAHWTTVPFPLQGGAIAFACPSSTVCFATGSGGDAARSADAGITWTPLTTGVSNDFLVAISCPNITTCFAVGSLGSIVATSDGGSTWVTRRNGAAYYAAYGISCPTTLVCSVGNANGLLETSDGGLSWTVVLHQYTQAVACPSATTCFAAGNPTYVTRDGGSTWTAMGASGANRQVIVCADGMHCLQSATTPIGYAYLLATADGGTTWTNVLEVQFPINFILGVNCTAGLTLCIAGASLGAMFMSANTGQTWTEVDKTVTRENFDAVSCASRLFCVGVGGSSSGTTLNIAVTHDGGTTWTVPTVSLDESLIAVSCASTSVCVAVGLNAHSVTTHDGGTTWTVTTIQTGDVLNMFVGVSCPSPSVCYAVTQGGLVFKSRDGGTTWFERKNLGLSFRGMDCPSRTVCYATAPEIGQSVVAMTFDGGATWSTAALPLMLIWSLSCTSTRHCVGVGTCHSIFYCNGNQAAVTFDSGKSWRDTLPVNDSPDFVSCGTSTYCVAAGAVAQGLSNIQVSSDGGLTWTDQPIVDNGELPGVSCVGLRCWAVGYGGAILAR